MFKSSNLYDNLHYQTSDGLTPIRDYQNDFFHQHDDNLPKFEKWQIRKLDSIKKTMHGTGFLSVKSVEEEAAEISESNEESLTDDVSDLSLPTAENDLQGITKQFYESELEYLETLNLVNTVYRAKLYEKRAKSFKRYLKLKPQEELLIFGNIDTISSISEIFVEMLRNIMNFDKGSPKKISLSSASQAEQTQEIISAFEQHLARCRSTYLNYTIAHSRQMMLYEEVSIRKNFGEWFEECLKQANFISLRDLLRYPISRIDSWLLVLNDLVELSAISTDDSTLFKLKSIKEKYAEFKSLLTDELNEYGSNNKLDCALSPTDIIQSYDSSEPADDRTMAKLPSEVPRLYRATSSRYDEQSTAVLDEVSTKNEPDKEKTVEDVRVQTFKDTPEQTSIPFADHIVRFTKIHQDIKRLIAFLHQMNLLIIPDNNIRMLKYWRKVVNVNNDITPSEDSSPSKLSNLDEYTHNINTLKERLTVLRLTDLEHNVLVPLTAMFEKCEAIKHHLRDLKTLEKDYILYLKEKKRRVTNIRTSVIGRHYEALREKFTIELPIFNKLVSQYITLWLKRYNTAMMEYYQILAGGAEQLRVDQERIALCRSDSVPPHSDLLQGYSIARTHIKHTVHSQWEYPGYPATSRVVRKLFEL
ncbi:Fus2 protein [Maudiozyma humilis]|uniref:Fus2 protein n=1 Tax=Maudiozyma humilis TaxID=51915 RepID=A0AAV5RZY2_MAUHU|nr:Fus2 protein [Kazachstania humilis]